MIHFLQIFRTSVIVFIMTLLLALWDYLRVTLVFMGVLFDLPIDAWEQAKEIESERKAHEPQ